MKFNIKYLSQLRGEKSLRLNSETCRICYKRHTCSYYNESSLFL